MPGGVTRKGKSNDAGLLFRAYDHLMAVGSLYSPHGTLGKLIACVRDRPGPSEDGTEGQKIENQTLPKSAVASSRQFFLGPVLPECVNSPLTTF